jgi:hypothetical protein
MMADFDRDEFKLGKLNKEAAVQLEESTGTCPRRLSPTEIGLITLGVALFLACVFLFYFRCFIYRKQAKHISSMGTHVGFPVKEQTGNNPRSR